MLDDRDLDRKSIVPTTLLWRRGDLWTNKKNFVLFIILEWPKMISAIYFGMDVLEALEIESKLLRSERFPTFGLLTTRTEGGDDSLFLLLRLKFLLPPTKIIINVCTSGVMIIWLLLTAYCVHYSFSINDTNKCGTHFLIKMAIGDDFLQALHSISHIWIVLVYKWC